MHTAHDMSKEIVGISPEALAMLQRYEWPGNVRELQHAIERAVILSTGPMLHPAQFEGQRFGLVHRWGGPNQAAAVSADVSNGQSANGQRTDDGLLLTSLNVGEAEALLIERALQVTEGNRTRAAELLGVSVRTLRNKLNSQRPETSG
jgi:DNA-binding NtrC family response regulator